MLMMCTRYTRVDDVGVRLGYGDLCLAEVFAIDEMTNGKNSVKVPCVFIEYFEGDRAKVLIEMGNSKLTVISKKYLWVNEGTFRYKAPKAKKAKEVAK